VSDWTILCDFDGTATVEDTTDRLLEAFARPGWETLEEAWRTGQIGSRECMAGQIALLDMDRAELDARLAACVLDPHFPRFVQAMHAQGIHVEIVSDGLDYAIQYILTRHGLDWLPVAANRLEAMGSRRWRLTFPNASRRCQVGAGNCKCARAARVRDRQQRVLLIGDGASDYCVAASADFVFAKGKLAAHCAAQRIAHAPIADFADALALMPELLAGHLAPRPPVTPEAVFYA
jgi:2,3-diketo-5-methylthio-1-phosphopentane phosphatase